MATIACDMAHIGDPSKNCDDVFSGYGRKIYAVVPEDLESDLAYDAKTNSFGTSAFTFKEGKGAYIFYCKKDSVQFTSTGVENHSGYQNQLVFNIERDLDNASVILRRIKNRGDIIFLAEYREGGKFDVLWDPTSGTTFNNNYDSGTTADSDSGMSCTATCPICLFSKVYWEGTLTIAKETV